jgi:hypothetical protein
MYSWEALPRISLRRAGPVSAGFDARDVRDFRAAGHYLQALPYGRTTDRADFRAVLREGRGTCSTKHALLATLAAEQDIPVVLTLGIYAMHDRNTPGVGTVLARHNLPSLPEAHCYIVHEGRRIDVTRSGAEATEPITELLYEEAIAPAQIGDYKRNRHQHFLKEWAKRGAAAVNGRSFEDLWQIREDCIAALTQ